MIVEAGLEPAGVAGSAGLPLLVHRATGQRFVRVPGGTFVMGWLGSELRAAFEEVGFDPEIASWRDAHRTSYELANPVRAVRVDPFLCGCSPLTGRAVDHAGAGVAWSTYAE